ncbi:hypothetical protein MATL_G00116700 [Megalops atlanticus]|uniref:Uncharacterized protein n=1 Tax=Megalops atlanticus TaxID=7932 RepID=A0A9D3Q1J8_MEGAT|nr:hypothetical protein MATL_G00116700 [Megalops atlanticus]
MSDGPVISSIGKCSSHLSSWCSWYLLSCSASTYWFLLLPMLGFHNHFKNFKSLNMVNVSITCDSYSCSASCCSFVLPESREWTQLCYIANRVSTVLQYLVLCGKTKQNKKTFTTFLMVVGLDFPAQTGYTCSPLGSTIPGIIGQVVH